MPLSKLSFCPILFLILSFVYLLFRGPGKSDLSVQIDNASAAKETKQNKKNKKKKSSDKEEMTHEGDSKSDMSKGVGSGDLEQNVDR